MYQTYFSKLDSLEVHEPFFEDYIHYQKTMSVKLPLVELVVLTPQDTRTKLRF